MLPLYVLSTSFIFPLYFPKYPLYISFMFRSYILHSSVWFCCMPCCSSSWPAHERHLRWSGEGRTSPLLFFERALMGPPIRIESISLYCIKFWDWNAECVRICMKFPDCHEFSSALLEEVQEKAEREQERPGHVPDLSSTLSECAFGGYRQGWKTES